MIIYYHVIEDDSFYRIPCYIVNKQKTELSHDRLHFLSLTFCCGVFQAILMSMCLQGMVDELIMKKEGRRVKRVSYYY